MLNAQRAFARDGESSHHDQTIALGHQLLEITAEDRSESQPLAGISHDSGRPVRMVADARIYNRNALARDFGLAESAALPDSAFVMKAWERWGQDCVDHLVGAFAFAVWDAEARQLFLACDHAGERPLYYVRPPGGFAFATSARALLRCRGVATVLDETTVARGLIGLPPEPFRTYFRDVRQVPPGHSMLVREDVEDAVPRRYWHFDRLPETRFARDRDYVDAFLEIFDEAVRCRLRTSGGIGSELSAGLDSGAVTATAAGLLRGSQTRLTSFTSVPCPEFSGLTLPNCIADEGDFAAEVAALYPNVDHVRVNSTGSDVMREMARVFPVLERPLGAPLNQVWLDLILDRAKDAGINVMLTGTQGNATISYAGNEVIGSVFRSGRWLKAFRLAYVLRRNGMSSGRDAASQTFFSLLPWWLRSRTDPWVRGHSLGDTAIRKDIERELRLFDALGRYTALSETGLPTIMEKVFHGKGIGEYNAMAGAGWGVELRDPTADKRVFEFCASIPMEQYMVEKPGRSLIRRAMRGRLPDSTLDRRSRGLQAADWYESLTPVQAELAAELGRLESSPGARRLLDLERLRAAMDHWPKSAGEAAEQAQLYRIIIPDAIATGYFMRRSEEIAAD
jgi:asparagine synthase (glutamine-hydrolysing)